MLASTRLTLLSLTLAAAALSVGCGGRRLLTVMPSTTAGAVVQEARVSVNGQFVGSGSVEVPRERTMVVTVDASPQYEPAQVQVDQRAQNPLVVTLREDEVFMSTVEDTNQVVNVWLTLNIGMQAQMTQSWWSTIINAISTQDFEPEMMDAASGFLRTAWKQVTFRSGASVRRRFVGNVVQTNPLQWRVRYEVQIMRPGMADWQDYPRGFRDELDALAEVRGRVSQ
ncbi:MAG: hypothetical protein K1X94_30915 [Sandaracinaceae bacterium]|nr:hypothetical protein [Sandaracinaceae bacterium]